MSQAIQGIGNYATYPILILIYRIFVVMPNQIIFLIFKLVGKMTGFSILENVGLNKANGGGYLTANGNSFMLTFFAIFGGSLIVGGVMFAIAIARAQIASKEEVQKHGEAKERILMMCKRFGFALGVSLILPLGFVMVTVVVGFFFQSIMSFSFDLGSQRQGVAGLVLSRLGSGPNALSATDRLNGLLVFSTWTVGYSAEPGSPQSISELLKSSTDNDMTRILDGIKELDNGI